MNGGALMILRGEIKTPPMSESARRETGFLLRRLQEGELIALPQSRPMPNIGARCRELRINDENKTWRIIYRIDEDAIVVVDVFERKRRKPRARSLPIANGDCASMTQRPKENEYES
jgi:phage-related protein